MAQEIKEDNILEVIENRKDSARHIIETSWNATKKPGQSVAAHFTKFHLTMWESMKNPMFAFSLTLGIVSQVLADILTPEEREELRKESTHIEGLKNG